MDGADDDALWRRLQALKGDVPANASEPPSDTELLARVRRVQGGPAVAPLPPPTAALPPRTSPAPPATAADARFGALLDAFDAHPPGGTDDADHLLAQAADAIRLGGGASGSGLGERQLRELAAGGDAGADDAPLIAPSRAQMRAIATDATGALAEAGAIGGVRLPGASAGACTDAGLFDSESDEDEAAEAERLLEQLADELALEEAHAPPAHAAVAATPSTAAPAPADLFPSAPSHGVRTPPSTAPLSSTPPKSPAEAEMERWCLICNEDASCWCVGCDGDPYCTRCWREGHVGPDASYAAHRTVPISAPRP
jgi:hypothetical protein